jgi:hypothetical protein
MGQKIDPGQVSVGPCSRFFKILTRVKKREIGTKNPDPGQASTWGITNIHVIIFFFDRKN